MLFRSTGAMRHRVPTIAVAVIVTGLVAGLASWSLWPVLEQQPIIRFVHQLPGSESFRFPGEPVMALSRDGRQFVYNMESGFYLRAMEDIEARMIPGTDIAIGTPTFSPDGQEVAYWDGPQVFRKGIGGGPALAISDSVDGGIFGIS